ncbi:MAG: type II secretion system F family protein [Moorellaceae bacterium]
MPNLAVTAAALTAAAVAMPALSRLLPRNREQFNDLFCRTGLRWASEEERNALAMKIARAGLSFTAEWFAGLRLCLVAAYILLCLFLMLMGTDMFWVMLFAPLPYVLPGVWLDGRVASRKSAIRLSLADFTVLLSTALSAGADPALALREAAGGVGGPLAAEVERALMENASGRGLVDALTDMAERCDVDELRALVRTITQAYRYGAPLADSMRAYASQMRTVRRFESMEAASKMSVKIIFPVVIFMLVPALVAIMYPAVVSLLQVLGF